MDMEQQFNVACADLVTAANELKASQAEVNARLMELEQKAVRGGGGDFREKSLGQRVIEADAFKALQVSRGGRARVHLEVKTVITSGGSSAGAFIEPDRVAPTLLPQRKLRVRDVLAQGRTTSNSIQYPRQTGRTNNAATVAENPGSAKPESAMAFELITAAVTTIAHWVPASVQVLDDAPMLRAIIDAELTYGLKLVEDNQLLNGAGTGTDIEGIYTTATAYSAPITLTMAGDLTKIDVLLLAIAQVQAANYEPDFVAINPLDWAEIQAHKTGDGQYLGAGPFSAEAVARLWRLPVVETQAMTLDNFLVGAGRQAQIFDRQDVTIEVSTEHSDFFTKNLVAVRAESRLELAKYRNDAFVKGTFTSALSA